MSKIHAELIAATGFAPMRGEDANKGLVRLALAVGDLADDKWAALSPEAADWYTAAANAINTNTAPPPFPDAVAAPAPARARARVAAPAPAPAPAPEPAPDEGDGGDLQVGWKVKVTSLRGVVTEGVISTVDEQGFVLEGGAEFDYDKVKECEVLDDGTAGGDAPDEASDDEVSIGDTVQVTTLRGAITMGNVKELGEDLIVLTKVDGTEAEFAPSRLKEIEIKSRAAQAAAPAPAPTRPVVRRGGAAAPAPAPAAAPVADAPRTRAGRNGGVTVGSRLREILAGNLAITCDQLAKQLAAEGFEAKEATVTMQYRDSMVLIEFLRKNGKLK